METEKERDRVAVGPAGGPRDLSGAGSRRLERFDEVIPDHPPDPAALSVGQTSPDGLPEKAGRDRVDGERRLERSGLAVEERLRRAAAAFRGLLDGGRRQLAREDSRHRQDRDGESSRSRAARQAAIGSSRSTRGESDSAPRSVQTMSSSMRTPKRPGR
ncbi:MAG: hypothetical protein DMF55_10225 [Acidobacteria bacterium]|nr:MAG: hypothetical protein DMF55_10225 [Acidobacteriota bacterium]